MTDFLNQIPLANNIAFRPSDIVLPAKYHKLHEDQEWFYDNIRTGQRKRRYAQKVQQSDKIYIETHRTDRTDVVLRIYNKSFQQQGSDISPDFIIYDSGSTYKKNDGTYVDLTVHKWQFRFSDYTLDDGEYFLVIVYEHYIGVVLQETRYRVSEPIDLREDHPDTILLEYFNNSNKDDIVYNYNVTGSSDYSGGFFFKPRWGLRIEGDMRPDSMNYVEEEVLYREQQQQPRKAYSDTSRTLDLEIGKPKGFGVPPYLVDKLFHIFDHDEIYYEGRRIEKIEGDSWDIEKDSDAYPFYSLSRTIQEYRKDDKITDVRGQKYTFFVEPASAPYYIYRQGFTINPYVLVAYVVRALSTAERNALLSYLNTVIVDGMNMSGTFSYDSGVYYYQNAVGENFIPDNGTILTSYITQVYTTAGVNETAQFTIKGLNGGVDWGDSSNNNFISAGTNADINHTYASAGTYNANVFAFKNQTFTSDLIINGSQFTGVLTNISDDAYSNLDNFLAVYADFSGLGSGLDLSFLANSAYSLKSLSLNACQLAAFDGSVFASFPKGSPVFGVDRWDKLTYISLYNNNLTKTEVEDFMNDFYVNTNHFTAGFLDFRQSSVIGAFASGTPQTQKDNLVNAGWTVLFN